MTNRRSFTDVAHAGTPVTAEAVPTPPRTPPEAASAPTPDLIDPRTGEIVDLVNAPSTMLIEVADFCARNIRTAKNWQTTAETELKRRLEEEGRRKAQIGDWELTVDKGSQSRVWDGVMLRAVVQDLITQGVVKAGDVTELVRLQVNGTEALALLNRLAGEPLAQVEECFHWERKGRPKLRISRIPNLGDALPE